MVISWSLPIQPTCPTLPAPGAAVATSLLHQQLLLLARLDYKHGSLGLFRKGRASSSDDTPCQQDHLSVAAADGGGGFEAAPPPRYAPFLDGLLNHHGNRSLNSYRGELCGQQSSGW